MACGRNWFAVRHILRLARQGWRVERVKWVESSRKRLMASAGVQSAEERRGFASKSVRSSARSGSRAAQAVWVHAERAECLSTTICRASSGARSVGGLCMLEQASQ